MAKGYAVPDSPSHINVLACEVVRLFEQLEAAERHKNYSGWGAAERASRAADENFRRVKQLEEQLETARIRGEALANAVEIIQEERDKLIDLLRVSVGFWIATPKELVKARHHVPHRDKVGEIASYVSTPAKERP